MRNYLGMEKKSLRELLKDRGLRLVDLASLSGLDKATMTRWDRGRVPAERVLDVERLTGISRHDLRPDIYPADDAGLRPAPSKAISGDAA